MYTDVEQPTNATFTVNFRFTEEVTGFDIDDISVDHGERGVRVSGSGRLYMVDVRPESDFEGLVTVTVRANAVEGRNNDGNARTSEDFLVDTRVPELDDATVDENELVLSYDEDLDETSEPSPSDFDVRVDGSDVIVFTVSVDGSEVTLILRDPASRGDRVTLDYSPPRSDPIQDLAGNEAELFTREMELPRFHGRLVSGVDGV